MHDFWIGIGDIHGDHDHVAAIPDLEQARGVLISGDITIKGGRAEAERVLSAVAARNPNILAQVGNMDLPEVSNLLDSRQWNIHAKGLQLAPAEGGLPLVGLVAVGASTPTPFRTPNEVSEEQIEAWLDQAVAQAPRDAPLLLVAHDPPHGSVADRLPDGSHVGSRAVRAFIEQHAPVVCLTGHIHESRGLGSIGETVVVNPGPLAQGGYVRIQRSRAGLEASLHQIA